jgi:GT2 family glycosyltransferase
MKLEFDVSIVIVNYNVKNLVEKCIESIYLNTSNLKVEIILVDNCSNDGSVEMIKSKFPDVVLIENKINKGFPAANNQAFKICKGEFVFMLNPDTEILNDAIYKLYSFIISNIEYSLVAPQLLNTNGTLQHSAWRFPKIIYVFADLFHLNFLSKSKGYNDKDLTKMFEADSYSGAAIFFRRNVFETVGMLDEKLFWIEDIDFCYRIKKAGLRMVYFPDAKILHHIGQSAKKNYNISISNQIFNKIKFFNTHHSKLETQMIKLISFFGVLFKIIIFAFLSFISKMYFLKLKAYLYTLPKVFNPPIGIK